MPKATKKKYYAVRRGREGPRIYETWDETKLNVSRFPGAIHKSFLVKSEAEEWLLLGGSSVQLDAQHVTTDSNHSNNMRNIPRKPLVDVQSTASPPIIRPSRAEPDIKLSPEQQQVLNKVKSGQNVFFTGSAGTGKSVLLREIIEWCHETNREVAVTASTGIASVNIGGCTLHSWAGVKLGEGSPDQLLKKLLGQDRNWRKKQGERQKLQTVPQEDGCIDEVRDCDSIVVRRWRRCQCLIIDEISMIDGLFLDKLEYIARELRGNQKPFGGIQLVLSGDFLQLPPVTDSKKSGDKDDESDVPIPAVFAFQAESWNVCIGRPISLKKVFRQKDPEFVNMLNEMRFGILGPRTIEAFARLSRTITYEDGIEPTELYAKRSEVSTANNRRLRALPSIAHAYQAHDFRGWNSSGNRITPKRMNVLLDRLVVQKSLTLKEGAQVMLIKNLVQGSLVNGTIGKVIGFQTTMEAAKRGIKLGIAEGSQTSAHNAGSSGRTEGNSIPNGIMHSPMLWPLVRFSPSNVEVLCIPNAFEMNNAEGGVEARREQVPLILAWALSIHKSQGQTLERVRVDLRSVFEKGQAYVALSRATSMATLEVRNFDPARVMSHPDVLEWMRENTSVHIPTSYEEDKLQFWSQGR